MLEPGGQIQAQTQIQFLRKNLTQMCSSSFWAYTNFFLHIATENLSGKSSSLANQFKVMTSVSKPRNPTSSH